MEAKIKHIGEIAPHTIKTQLHYRIFEGDIEISTHPNFLEARLAQGRLRAGKCSLKHPPFFKIVRYIGDQPYVVKSKPNLTQLQQLQQQAKSLEIRSRAVWNEAMDALNDYKFCLDQIAQLTK